VNSGKGQHMLAVRNFASKVLAKPIVLNECNLTTILTKGYDDDEVLAFLYEINPKLRNTQEPISPNHLPIIFGNDEAYYESLQGVGAAAFKQAASNCMGKHKSVFVVGGEKIKCLGKNPQCFTELLKQHSHLEHFIIFHSEALPDSFFEHLQRHGNGTVRNDIDEARLQFDDRCLILRQMTPATWERFSARAEELGVAETEQTDFRRKYADILFHGLIVEVRKELNAVLTEEETVALNNLPPETLEYVKQVAMAQILGSGKGKAKSPDTVKETIRRQILIPILKETLTKYCTKQDAKLFYEAEFATAFTRLKLPCSTLQDVSSHLYRRLRLSSKD